MSQGRYDANLVPQPIPSPPPYFSTPSKLCLQVRRPFNVFCVSSCPPSLRSRTHSEASTSYSLPAGPTSGSHEKPTLFSQNALQSHISDEGAPSVPPYPRSTSQYPGNFFPNPENQSVPLLHRAKWDSPPQVDEEPQPNYHQAGLRPPVDPRGGPSREEEGPPSSRGTLPPLNIPYHSLYLDVHTTSGSSHISSCEHASDRGNVSTTSSGSATSRPTNRSNTKHRWVGNLFSLCRR
jgi:hypothetical protein